MRHRYATDQMPEHKFTYPRVVPAPRKAPGAVSPDGRKPGSQRDLVAASLLRCPPRAANRPRHAR